jgi:hypothetical protein
MEINHSIENSISYWLVSIFIGFKWTKFFGKMPDTWGLFTKDPKYHSKTNDYNIQSFQFSIVLPSHSSRTCTPSPNNKLNWSGDEAVNEHIAWKDKRKNYFNE